MLGQKLPTLMPMDWFVLRIGIEYKKYYKDRLSLFYFIRIRKNDNHKNRLIKIFGVKQWKIKA